MIPKDRVPDVYFSEDYPVLLAIARWDLDESPQSILRPEVLATRLGQTNDVVMASIGRLFRGGYIEAHPLGLDQTDYYMVKRLTPVGLREVGAWPNVADLANAFKNVIEREAIEAEKTDPANGKKLRQLLGIVEELGVSYAAKVTVELAKAAAHLP